MNALIYEPPAPPVQPTVPPSYELKQDVTGEELPKRGPQVLKDLKGNELPVPFAPKPHCKKCYGRGYVGVDAIKGGLIACRKCYSK
jgi:hypothetical protein